MPTNRFAAPFFSTLSANSIRFQMCFSIARQYLFIRNALMQDNQNETRRKLHKKLKLMFVYSVALCSLQLLFYFIFFIDFVQLHFDAANLNEQMHNFGGIHKKDTLSILISTHLTNTCFTHIDAHWLLCKKIKKI